MMKLRQLIKRWLFKSIGWQVYYVGGSEGLPPPLSRNSHRKRKNRLYRRQFLKLKIKI